MGGRRASISVSVPVGWRWEGEILGAGEQRRRVVRGGGEVVAMTRGICTCFVFVLCF